MNSEEINPKIYPNKTNNNDNLKMNKGISDYWKVSLVKKYST